jgi:sulfate transport system ATP-binding protein
MIELRGVSKRFGRFAAVRDVSLKVEDGELVALLGPSGSGKTTLLRILAGLERPDAGTILFDRTDTTRLSARDRRVGFVFQHYALFRHMRVLDNVAFGLRVRPRRTRPSRAEREKRARELLELVQISQLAHRYPSQLSGGQRQRVALARALAVVPRILLLDEPFGALDAKVRKELRRGLRELHDRLGITSVFVTHDQEEAIEIADRIVVMNQGAIEQVGTPTEVFDAPRSPFVFEFMGHVNRLPCTIRNREIVIGGLHLPAPEYQEVVDDFAVAFVRPHDLEVVAAGTADALEATVLHEVVLGPTVRLELRVDKLGVLEAEVSRVAHDEFRIARGAKVGIIPRRMQTFLSGGAAGPAVVMSAKREPSTPPEPEPAETPKGRLGRPSSEFFKRFRRWF